MQMSLKSRIQIVPLQRSKPQSICICRQPNPKDLQSRILIQSSYNRQATQLNISHNKIPQLPTYDDRFQSLIASQCRLREIVEVLGSNLLKVDLSHNNLTKIPYFQSRRLEVLWLKNNRIEALDIVLMRYPLRELKIAGNNVKEFYVGVLQKKIECDVEILRFVQVEGLDSEQYISLEEIMEKTGSVSQRGMESMMKKAIDCEYPQMISYLSRRMEDQVDAFKLANYAQHNNLYVALEAIIKSFRIQEGFQKERTMFLNPESFSPDRLKQQIDFKILIQALCQQNTIDPSKSISFLKYIYSKLSTLLNRQNFSALFLCGNIETVLQILDFEDISPYCSIASELIVSAIIDYDKPELFAKLIQIQELKNKVFGKGRKPKLLMEIDPSHCIFKHVLKHWKSFIRGQLKRKVFHFVEYQSNVRCNTETDRSSKSTPRHPKLLNDYEQIQRVFNEYSYSSNTPTKSYADQENRSHLNLSGSRYTSISKQISDRFNKNTKKPFRSMAALALQKFNA